VCVLRFACKVSPPSSSTSFWVFFWVGLVLLRLEVVHGCCVWSSLSAPVKEDRTTNRERRRFVSSSHGVFGVCLESEWVGERERDDDE
jgi:hypothetical protein